MSKKKILVLPSWYASPEAPTSGSFFKEQAELMQPEFDVKVLVSDKRWISSRRYVYEMFRPYSRPFLPFFLETPPTLLFEFDFVSFSLCKKILRSNCSAIRLLFSVLLMRAGSRILYTLTLHSMEGL